MKDDPLRVPDPTERVTDRVDPWLDPHVAERVLGVLVDELDAAAWSTVLVGAAAPVWSEAAPKAGVRHELVVGSSDARADLMVCCSPDTIPADPDGHPDFVTALTTAARVVALATTSPVSATATPGRWPAYWADLFDRRGWCFVDVVRPTIWDDTRIGPDVKEGLLVFAGPTAARDRAVSPPLALVHPHRIVAAVRGVQAELGLVAERLEGAAATIAAQVARIDDLAVAADTGVERIDALEVRAAAADTRATALERRLGALTDHVLTARERARLPVEVRALRSGLRGLAGRSLRWLLGQPSNGAGGSSAVSLSQTDMGELFDEAFYLEARPDGAGDAFGHYVSVGESSGVRPNPWFDPTLYRAENPDVVAAGLCLLQHFAEHGGFEGRRASAEFDTAWYCANYVDVAPSGLNPLVHFLAVGRDKGYRPTAP